MKIYLAGIETYNAYFPNIDLKSVYSLTTYYHLKSKKDIPKYVSSENLILDSGAFTFFSGKKVNWDNYLNDYINFINKTNKKYFFELDIDSIVGLNQVEKMTKKITNKTGKKPIPVWHPSRGVDYFKKMIDEYDYIALSLSGKYTSSWVHSTKSTDVINKLLSLAKNNSCKVHGLGFTKLKNLDKCHFYSVDSTAWISAMKYGKIMRFNGQTMEEVKRPQNTLMINPKDRLKFGFEEWVKFQKYAEVNL